MIDKDAYRSLYTGVLPAQESDLYLRPRQEVAIKVFKNVATSLSGKSLMNEVEILASLAHPAIVNYVTFSISPKFAIVRELYPTNLSNVLGYSSRGLPFNLRRKDGTAVSRSRAREITAAIGISSGLAYLHEMNVVHKNAKPANILLDENLHPKISGFELAQPVDAGITPGVLI